MKTIRFYALKEDLLKVLRSVESTGSLQYVRMGNFLASEIESGIEVYKCGEDIPHLGKATADSSAACDSYLVCDCTTHINLRSLHGLDGINRVCIDQLVNPDTVVFNPGGLWSDDLLLHGHIGTASESDASKVLMKHFNVAMKNTFTKVKAFYVGSKALELLERGARLTISVQSPREFDLSPVRDG